MASLQRPPTLDYTHCPCYGEDAVTKDFFISYNKADATWAEWIAWVLEEHGKTVVIQAECVNKNETKNKRELVWNRLAARIRHWWIDPNGRGYHGWAGRMMDKALRMGEISRG